MPQIYKSKIDAWLLLTIGAAIVITIVGVAMPFVVETPNAELQLTRVLPGLVIGVLAGVGLPLWILANTNYTLTDMTLHVRCGPFSYKVPIAEISSVTPTRSILSAPALSLDRLRIEYSRGKVVVISPEDRERFLKDLDIRRRRRS
jgi:Protein of unknown function (DUF1200).